MDNIIENMEKRFQTLMIGAISRFENSFGYLWNHGDEPKTDNQYLFRDKWENLRQDLLNHGNFQIRQAVKDLEKHFHASKYKYQYNFKFNKKLGE